MPRLRSRRGASRHCELLDGSSLPPERNRPRRIARPPAPAIPNLVAMYRQFDQQYFYNQLENSFFIEWCNSMVRQSGVTYHEQRIIRISRPIHRHLSLRELEETVLHEMIHAYLDVMGLDVTHGPHFYNEMGRISRAGGYQIAEFHDAAYLLVVQRHWMCTWCGLVRIFYRAVDPENHRSAYHPCFIHQGERLLRGRWVPSKIPSETDPPLRSVSS